VLDFARQRFDALASMVDAVALLDMCHGFADCVASSSSVWCRPVVSDGGTLAILEGRYPIEQTGVAMDFVPNDVFASPLANFTLISGVRRERVRAKRAGAKRAGARRPEKSQR
jgi:DNA mismatch repair protein MSH4